MRNNNRLIAGNHPLPIFFLLLNLAMNISIAVVSINMLTLLHDSTEYFPYPTHDPNKNDEKYLKTIGFNLKLYHTILYMTIIYNCFYPVSVVFFVMIPLYNWVNKTERD